MNWKRRVRWIVLYPILFLMGCHMLLTGSPIPLWRIESLDSPVAVQSITRTQLVLADGRTVSVPFMKELPVGNPLFEAALSDGVEVHPTGEVYGLIWSDKYCGNDPIAWCRSKVDLSILAGALHPEGIDESLLPPYSLSLIHDNCRVEFSASNRSHQRRRLSGWDSILVRRVQREFHASVGRSE